MFKKILVVGLCLAFVSVGALAEVYGGTTVARNERAITASAAGVIEEMHIRVGGTVKEGDLVAQMHTTKVFADQDGTVVRIHAKAGSGISGSVLEISPISRYTIYCTTDEAYDATDNDLIHCGETLYLSCTYNGTHRGSGIVYAIDNETYMVEAVAGEFYVGETVYLYRDAEYSYKQRVGIGTVVSSDTELYEASGRISEIYVSEGEYVEKGELLYELFEGDEIDTLADTEGVITACNVNVGDSVQKGQTLAFVAPYEEICVAVQIDEAQAGDVSVGDEVILNYACDEDTLYTGSITEISGIAEDGGITVYIASDVQINYIGISVNVRINPDD